MQRPKALVVTDKSIWRLEAGAHARTHGLANYLASKIDMTVAALGPTRPGDEDILKTRPRSWRFAWLDRDRTLQPAEYAKRLHNLCLAEGFDVCIVERLHLAYLRDALPTGTRAFIDTTISSACAWRRCASAAFGTNTPSPGRRNSISCANSTAPF
jgi:hypothetical protein